MIFDVRTIGSGTKFRFLALEPPVLALDIYHSSWRNSLPFTSLRSVTIGSGRDFLEGDTRRGQAQGLLELADYVPVVAAAAANVHGSTHAEIIAEDQAVRAVASIWSSTRCPIVAVGAHECQPTKEVDT